MSTKVSALRTALSCFLAVLIVSILSGGPMSAQTVGGALDSVGVQGQAYSSFLTVTGGIGPTYTWSVANGSLPAGLALDSSTGVVSGIPTTAAAYNFRLSVTDSNNSTAFSTPQNITIFPQLLVTTSSLPATTVGAPYAQGLTFSGGTTPNTWSIPTGSLPPGISLTPSTGNLAGTATIANTYSFTAQVACCGPATAQASLSILVNPAPAITTGSLPNGSIGIGYSQTLSATGGTGGLAWQVTGGAVPTGMTLSAGGQLSGTPTALGTFNFTAQVKDTLNVAATQSYSVQIFSLPTITTSSLNTVTVGQSVSATLVGSGGSTPYNWSVAFGSLPNGISLNGSTGVLAGTPTGAESPTFSIRLTDSLNQSTVQAYTWNVSPAPVINTSSLPATTVGAAYSQSESSSGGTGNLIWSISGGALPSGLNINSSSGAITGTATSAGTANFTVKVTDQNGVEGTKGLSILVNAPTSVTTTTLPFGVIPVGYSQTLTASGGTAPLSWSVVGNSLPNGLTLSSGGVISGTPTATGTSSFTVQVIDSLGILATQSLSIEVVNQPVISTTSLSTVTVGQSVSTTLVGTNGTPAYQWSVSAGSLPGGITLNSSTGALTGVPTSGGTFPITFKITDSHSIENTQAISWIVSAAPAITTSSLPDTTVGATFSQALTSSGGTAPLAWSVVSGALPGGLTLNGSTGIISGTPTAAAPFTFTVRILDANGVEATRGEAILVNPAPVITTSALSFAVTTVAYSQMLAATGGTGALAWTVSVGSLPAGLSLNSSTGAITGTPTAIGTVSFTIKATDTVNVFATKSFSIEVVDNPTVVTTTLNPITVTQPVTTAIAGSNGTAPYTWSVTGGSLPAGISLNTSTGQLTGAPTTAGAASFTVKIVDSHNLEITQGYSWTVNPAPAVTTSTLPAGSLGIAYSQILSASGGTGSLTWSVSVGSLPGGLNLSSAGIISGTPTAGGTSNFTVKAVDVNGVEATGALTILVNAVPVITTSSVNYGVIGVAFSQALTSVGGTGVHTWSISAGSLPSGLTMNSSGVITGLPTATGTAAFTVKATDTLGAFAAKVLTIDIVQPLLILSANLGQAAAGQSFGYQLSPQGGKAPYTWAAVDALPPGLAIGANTGVLAGTPTVGSGQNTFTLRVTDTYGATATRAFSLSIKTGLVLVTQSLPNASVGAPYSATLLATGAAGAVTWTASGLPPGITLDSKTGELRGTFAGAGEPGFTITVTDAEGTSISRLFSIRVGGSLQISTDAIPAYHRDQLSTFQLEAVGGQVPFTWQAADALPAGLRFSTSGVLTGTPSVEGTFGVTFSVQDATGASTRRKLDIVVNAGGGIRISSTKLLFDGVASGPASAPQQVEVGSAPASRFTVSADAPWIRTSFSDAFTPGVLGVTADPSALASGLFHGAITLTAGAEMKTITVDFTVGPQTAASITAEPSRITITTSREAGIQHQLLAVTRTGAESVTAQPGPGAPWLKAVVGSPSLVDIQVDPSALDAGIYEGVVTVASGSASTKVPVKVTIGAGVFEVSRNAITLEVAAADGSSTASTSQQIMVLNRDRDPRAWYAQAAAPWIRLDPAVGIANPRSPLDIGANAAGLDPGIYATSVTVLPRFGGNPIPVDVVFNVAASSPAPQTSPAGLAFRATAGAAAPAGQAVTLRNGSTAPMSFITAIEPASASSWLSIIPPSGTIAPGGVFALPVSVRTADVATGVYQANINIEFADQTVRVVRVLLTVAGGGCKATAIYPMWTKPGDHFKAQAGLPTAVEVLAIDNCGNSITQGAVLVHFSDRTETALPLIAGGNGLWTGTWTPALAHGSITATADAEDLGTLKGQALATGVVSPASSAKVTKF